MHRAKVAGVLAACTLASAAAHGRVFVCIENGQKVFRSSECPDPKTQAGSYSAPSIRVIHSPRAYSDAVTAPAAVASSPMAAPAEDCDAYMKSPPGTWSRLADEKLRQRCLDRQAGIARGAATALNGSAIESQIDGDFEGWEGDTVVKLMNGQIWRQTDSLYLYHYAFMPKVIVYSGDGGYKMKVDGMSTAVHVEQLR
jgi:hypothetical protein